LASGVGKKRRLDPEAAFSNMAEAIAKKSNFPFAIDRHVASEALFEIIHAYWDDAYELEIDEVYEPIATMWTTTSKSKNPTLDVSDAVSETNVQAFFACIKNVISDEAKRCLIESTSDAELKRAHKTWIAIIRLGHVIWNDIDRYGNLPILD
jgi:hypothetical protein